MDYQTFHPLTKPSLKQRASHRNIFAEHNYNYVSRSKTSKPSNMKTQNNLYSQCQNTSQSFSNSVFFNDQPRSTQDQCENYPCFSTKQK